MRLESSIPRLSVGNASRDYLVAGICECHFLASQVRIVFNHHADQFPERDFRLPSQFLSRLAGVAQEVVDLSGTKVSGIGLDVLFPIEVKIPAREIQKVPD